MRTNLSLFNKYASEKFQSLEDEDKARFVDDAASEDNSLTDAEIANRIRDIFGQLRDKTVRNNNYLNSRNTYKCLSLLFITT